jgi:hypothetical protein
MSNGVTGEANDCIDAASIGQETGVGAVMPTAVPVRGSAVGSVGGELAG